jgi:hypothetical protein
LSFFLAPSCGCVQVWRVSEGDWAHTLVPLVAETLQLDSPASFIPDIPVSSRSHPLNHSIHLLAISVFIHLYTLAYFLNIHRHPRSLDGSVGTATGYGLHV